MNKLELLIQNNFELVINVLVPMVIVLGTGFTDYLIESARIEERNKHLASKGVAQDCTVNKKRILWNNIYEIPTTLFDLSFSYCLVIMILIFSPKSDIEASSGIAKVVVFLIILIYSLARSFIKNIPNMFLKIEKNGSTKSSRINFFLYFILSITILIIIIKCIPEGVF